MTELAEGFVPLQGLVAEICQSVADINYLIESQHHILLGRSLELDALCAENAQTEGIPYKVWIGGTADTDALGQKRTWGAKFVERIAYILRQRGTVIFLVPGKTPDGNAYGDMPDFWGSVEIACNIWAEVKNLSALSMNDKYRTFERRMEESGTIGSIYTLFEMAYMLGDEACSGLQLSLIPGCGFEAHNALDTTRHPALYAKLKGRMPSEALAKVCKSC
jgi:hypothetical protein